MVAYGMVSSHKMVLQKGSQTIPRHICDWKISKHLGRSGHFTSEYAKENTIDNCSYTSEFCEM